MTAILQRADRFLTKHFTRPSITWRESVAIVLPLIAENLFTVLFGLLNTGMISSSGVTSLSAVSLVDTLNNFLFVFYIGIATGAGVIVANYRGRGDQNNLHEACLQAVTSVTSPESRHPRVQRRSAPTTSSSADPSRRRQTP